MTCPKCGSDRVNVQIVQSGAITRTKKHGCLFGLFRFILILCTCGLWLLVGRKKYKSKTKIKNANMAVCSNCGNTWAV